MSNDLLFEIGTEELPSGSVWPLAEALLNQTKALFAKENIKHGKARAFATPRRLAIWIESVATQQEDQQISRRGPSLAQAMDEEGKPTKALIGFAKSCNVPLDALTTLTTDKGAWWVYEATKQGSLTRDLIPELLRNAVASLPIAKGMRWGDGDVLFARPVHWVVLLFGQDVLDAEILGLKAGRESFGHRFHAPQAITIENALQYEKALEDAFVIADFDKRRQIIKQQVETLAEKEHKYAVMPQALLDEVTSIVEWPMALLAQFDEEFLEVPKEALIAAMQSHQKSFALCDEQQKLTSYFITVANISSQNPEKVILGNEKVMRARLSDAAFFYRQDKKRALSDLVDATKTVVFQAKLGSLYDKSLRLRDLMTSFSEQLHLNKEHALRVSALSKCDLMTGMVGEFPELQGLMGFYYAQNDKEDPAVAQALNEQYMPRYSGDELPQSDLGLALSLADRMDNLVGAFMTGQKPSGVKDPFKLRRQALATVRLLMATSKPLYLSSLIEQALKGYGSEKTALVDELKPFILDRLFSYYQALGTVPSFVHASLARQDDWLYDTHQRIKALESFIQLPEATLLSSACKRVNNLLQQNGQRETAAFCESLLCEPAEKALFMALQATEEKVKPYYLTQEYVQILNELAHIQKPLDAFFEQVMVMVDEQEIRENRLCLLARLQAVLMGVADISLL